MDTGNYKSEGEIGKKVMNRSVHSVLEEHSEESKCYIGRTMF